MTTWADAVVKWKMKNLINEKWEIGCGQPTLLNGRESAHFQQHIGQVVYDFQ